MKRREKDTPYLEKDDNISLKIAFFRVSYRSYQNGEIGKLENSV